MGKVQKISRANGTVITSVNIPCSLVDDLKLEKGEELTCKIVNFRGSQAIIFFREDLDGGE